MLDMILDPVSLTDFFENYWLKEALYIPCHNNKSFNSVFSWKDFNYLLNFSELNRSTVDIIVDGKNLSMHGIGAGDLLKGGNLASFFQKGATIKVNQIQKRLTQVSEFAALLRGDVGYEINVNSYCSFPGTQAYDCHYDTHEVIILQVEGTKEWKIFRDTLKYPSPSQRSVFYTPPNEDAYLKCVLSPGDVLYIPRGHWHYALALHQPSLHLTLGIHPPMGTNFINWMIDDLQKQENWRKSLPLYALQKNDTSLKKRLKELTKNLIEYLSNEELSLRYIHYLKMLERPSQNYSIPYQAGFGIFTKGVNTKFARLLPQRVQILAINEREYKINVWNKEIVLKQVPKEFVETLFTKSEFNAQEILTCFPDLDWEAEVAPILSTLVIEGIIKVDEE